LILSAKNYASPADFGKVMPKNRRVLVFLRRGSFLIFSAENYPQSACFGSYAKVSKYVSKNKIK